MKPNAIFAKSALVLLIAILSTSCRHNINFGNSGREGNGNVVLRERTISEEFKSIDVSTGIEVVVEQSDTKKVTVEIDENLQDLIETKVENGVLMVYSKEGYNAENTPKVFVKMPVIDELITSSGAHISSEKTLISENMTVRSSSGSSISITVEADLISLETTSGSNMTVRGKALKLETSSSSGSVIEAQELHANDINSQSSSGSSTHVFPIVSLTAKASSGSSIGYHKLPKSVSKEESSGGSVSEE